MTVGAAIPTPASAASADDTCTVTKSVAPGALQDFRDRLGVLRSAIVANSPKTYVAHYDSSSSLLSSIPVTSFASVTVRVAGNVRETSGSLGYQSSGVAKADPIHQIDTPTAMWVDLTITGENRSALPGARALLKRPSLRWSYEATPATPPSNGFADLIDESLALTQAGPEPYGSARTPAGVVCTTLPNGSKTFSAQAEVTGPIGEESRLATLTFNSKGELVSAVDSTFRTSPEGTKSSLTQSRFEYVPVTIKLPTAATYLPATRVEPALASATMRTKMSRAAAKIISSANADGRATPAEIRFFARQACAAGGGFPFCTVQSLSNGARFYTSDPFTSGAYAIRVIVKKGKAVRP